MPPVNTPAVTSPTSRRSANAPSPIQHRPLTPLSYLSSPVPDLASTLHTSAADEADEANVSFLRDSLESLDESSQPQRSQLDQHQDPRQSSQTTAQSTNSQPLPVQARQETPEDLSRRERLQRVLARLNRLHEPSVSSTAAYSNRTPSPNRQSLYDWAPAYDDSDSELDAILNELRRQQPETHPNILRVLSQSQVDGQFRQRDRSGNATPAPPDITDVAERRERLRERERRRQNEWASLRARAAIQRSRQDGSPSATDRMLRYMLERERSGMSEEEERARGTGWFRPNASRIGNEEQRNTSQSGNVWTLPSPARDPQEQDRQERVEAFRRGYLAENVPPRVPPVSTPPMPTATVANASPSSPVLENALKYLSELRSCASYEDALSTAIDHGLATKEFFADKHDDFIMDLSELGPLQDSSWLQPGGVFEGYQNATNGSGNITQRNRPASSSHVVEQINPNYRNTPAYARVAFDHPPGSTQVAPASFDTLPPWPSYQILPQTINPATLCKPAQDRTNDQWPVRVIMHSIDVEKMTLQATMEAYDVPQHPASLSILGNAGQDRPRAGKKNAPITTYLEGHIIDRSTHSFLTPSNTESKKAASSPRMLPNDSICFPSASAATDAVNWRKLPPFSYFQSDDEAFRALLSKSKSAKLNEEYIFMRWKERCFVHAKDDKCKELDRNGDQDRGHGLTISGFYYISLRRIDGVVAGLYYDPTSTPYQHMRLRGKRAGWPAFGFR